MRVVCLVQSEELVPDQILSRSEILGDSGGPVQSIHDSVTSPFARVLGSRDKALVVDFELRWSQLERVRKRPRL